jgi:diguanylate cyclase (GGDEF)-like protein
MTSTARDGAPLPTGDRGQGSRDRDITADAHDVTSDARDERARMRDERADRRQDERGLDPEAAADRASARRDRMSSATDRMRARDDRAAASADRARAEAERLTLAIDELTGALARKPGLAELDREIVRAHRTGDSFILAFVDIDGLKTTNDELGHPAGDARLQGVVGALRATVREYDLIVRYGGDEFLCGVPDLGFAEVSGRLENTRASLAADRGNSFTVGLAQLRPDEDLSSLIARADTAMYQARRTRSGS